MKIVINVRHGGFGLSEAGMRALAKRRGIETLYVESQYGGAHKTYYTVPPEDRPEPIDWDNATRAERIAYNLADGETRMSCFEIERTDPDLVAVVEELGEDANGWAAHLEVVDVPDDVHWEIEDYDGVETVREVSRSWP